MAISERDLNTSLSVMFRGCPERGLEMFAAGIEKKRAEIQRLPELAEEGEGVFKFLRGATGAARPLWDAWPSCRLRDAVSRRASWWSRTTICTSISLTTSTGKWSKS